MFRGQAAHLIKVHAATRQGSAAPACCVSTSARALFGPHRPMRFLETSRRWPQVREAVVTSDAGVGCYGQDMIQWRDALAGVDDFVAELALARRARQRLASLCERHFTHPRRPTQFDALGYLVVETCACLLSCGHDECCVCEHNSERVVYRVDEDGREHYATRPLGG